jgi:protease I
MEEGAEVLVAAESSAKTYESKHDYPAQPDVDVGEVRAEDLDAIVIPGGVKCPDLLRRHEGVLDLVRRAFGKGKVVASICHAAWVPISAGIVEGRRMTCYFSVRDDVVNAGADYEDSSVVRDGNLISSRHPGDLPDFCSTIIEALSEK